MNIDPVVVAATITATATVIVALLTLFEPQLQKRFERRRYQPISKGREKRIEGNWIGEAYQPTGPNSKPIQATVHFVITVSANLISGKATFTIDSNGIRDVGSFVCTGGFLFQRFLRMSYDPDTSQGLMRFGSFFVELSADETTLTGAYVGYGIKSETVVYGTINLRKQ